MRRGPKPKGQVKLIWSRKFAYAIGLLTADGCLSKDGRHIDFTSKDKELVELFQKCLDLKAKVNEKSSGAGGVAFHVQFSDTLFYAFLLKIGLMPAKSKTIVAVEIPEKYFFSFLRGYFDGDGSSYSYWDPVFKKSFRFYISFASASPMFLAWLQSGIYERIQIKGYINRYPDRPYVQLKYSKKEAVVLSKKMYYRAGVLRLGRKYVKVALSLSLIE